jgi:hypothetical protein
MVSAHELGHNFGAAHSHCTNLSTGAQPTGSNDIDQCYNGDASAGCYSGPQACPAPSTVNGVGNVTGTLMSYCHLNGISGCGTSLVFADIQRSVLNGYIGASYNYPACITPAGTGAVNQAPGLSLPASIGVAVNKASALTGMSFTDPDAGAGSLTATFSVASGALNASSAGGVTAAGTTSARTLAGTLANLNAYLAAGNLKYTSTANASASITLSVSINDNGNTGSGGAKSASGSTSLLPSAGMIFDSSYE